MTAAGTAFAQGQPGGQASVLTLQEAIATAVANNPGLAVARERVQRSQNQLREAKAQSVLRLDGSANYVHTSPISTFTVPGPSGTPITIQTRQPNATAARAAVTQPVDITGRLRDARELAGLQLDIQSYSEGLTLQQLIADVQNAYYNVLRAEGNVNVAQAAVNLAEERLRLARAQFEAGVSPKFDVTRAEVDVANFRQTLIQAQNAVAVAKGALNNVLGVDVNRPFEVQEQPAAVKPVTVDIAAETERALTARPEMQQARLGIQFAERNVSFTSKEDKPAVGLFAASDWTSATSAFNNVRTTYTYGANVTWPVWTGGVTKARIAEARNDVQIARRNLDQARLGVELDVRTAALNVMESSRRVETAGANVDQAREALRLARVRYQEGVATEVEVTSAEAALTQALTNEVNSRYDYLSAVAQLQRATAAQPEYARLTSPAPAAGAFQGVTR